MGYEGQKERHEDMRKKECEGVFRRSKAIKCMAAILGVAGVFVSGSAAQCKVITYPNPEVVLSTDPFGREHSLFTSDSLSGNSVTLNAGGMVEGHVYGGVSLYSDVYENVVMVYGEVGGSVAGGRSEDGDVTGNKAVVSADVSGSAFGGWTENGDATSNSLIVNGGTVEEDVYGGYSDYGNAIGNDLVVNGGNARFIYGGYSFYSGDAKYNTVKMTDGFSDNLIGGRSTDGDVTGNIVEVSGGTISKGMAGGGGISGGETDSGNAVGNTVKITGGSADWIVGAYSGSGDVTGNSVEVNGGTVIGNIQGGESDSGNVEANIVKMTEGSAIALIGGYSYSGNVTGNSVEIDGGTIDRNINGGNSETGNAVGNTVKMTGGSANWVIGAYSYQGDATGNMVDVSGGNLDGGVSGGESGSGNAENNVVVLDNVTATYLNGGYSDSGSSNGNSVVMNGGAVDYNAFGGYVDSSEGTASNNSFTLNGGIVSQSVFGGRSWSGNAENNVVTLNSGEIRGDVYGGYSSSGNATYNTVNLLGTPDLSSSTVYGGYSFDGDCFTGNILNVNHGFEGSLIDVKNFNIYNFSPTALSHNGQTILTLTNSQGTDLSDSTFKVTADKIAGGGERLKVGDKVNLMYNANGITTSGMDIQTPEVKGIQRGITLSYDFLIKAEADRITMEVTSVKANPEAIELSEGRAAELNILTQAAQKAAGIQMDRQDKLTPFMSFDAGHSRYNIGYNPTTNSVNGIVGVKMGFLNQTLTIAPFIEIGCATNKVTDRYESTNQYYGAGVTTQYDIYKGIYAKGAFRIGRSKNDFDSLDLTDVNGARAAYKTDSTYTGAEIGAGWIYEITENTTLDLYGRYFYSYISENSAEILEDPLEFSRVDSHRVNLGVRVDRKLTSKMEMYCKASFEREFAGEVNARTYGYQIEPLVLKGNILGAEIGLKGKTKSSLSWNIGIQGYMGQRKGVQGNVALSYLF